VHFEKVVAGFRRYHKYTLGAELRNQSRAVVSAIVRANSQPDKLPALLGLRIYLPRLIANRRTVMLITEREPYLTAIKTRPLVSRYEPLAA
jgi:hypothetical protein